jgi:hypothetical protein
MSDTTGTGKPIKALDLELSHPPDGTSKDNGCSIGLLTKGTKPPPPPEPPPTIFNIHKNLNMNGMVYEDPPIFNHSSKFKGKDIKWKFQNIAPYYYKGSQCNVFTEWENGVTTNKILKVICTDTPVTCSLYARENFPLDKPG